MSRAKFPPPQWMLHINTGINTNVWDGDGNGDRNWPKAFGMASTVAMIGEIVMMTKGMVLEEALSMAMAPTAALCFQWRRIAEVLLSQGMEMGMGISRVVADSMVPV